MEETTPYVFSVPVFSLLSRDIQSKLNFLLYYRRRDVYVRLKCLLTVHYKTELMVYLFMRPQLECIFLLIRH